MQIDITTRNSERIPDISVIPRNPTTGVNKLLNPSKNTRFLNKYELKCIMSTLRENLLFG